MLSKIVLNVIKKRVYNLKADSGLQPEHKHGKATDTDDAVQQA
jgi:hypothetical protein